MRKAVSAAIFAAVVVRSGRSATSQEVWPWPKPRMATGLATPRALARSALMTTTAAAPSDTRQQSSRRSGSTTRRDSRYCSSVMALRSCACGLAAPCLRAATAMAPKPSLGVPYCCMWRWATMAYPAGVPNQPKTASSPQAFS